MRGRTGIPVQRAALLAAMLTGSVACGGTSTPASPTPAPASGPSVTITTSGVSPKVIEVALGSRVLFVNDDRVSHHVGSDPHPDHTECPDINNVGVLLPGQRRETGNLVQVRSCGYHDHDRPGDQSLHGRIVVR